MKCRILERKLIWFFVDNVLIHRKINDLDKDCKTKKHSENYLKLIRVKMKITGPVTVVYHTFCTNVKKKLINGENKKQTKFQSFQIGAKIGK